jgi:hypothetical protein
VQKIDWKHVSKTSGYLSLKAAYVKDLNCPPKRLPRSKANLKEKFYWIINRAKYFANYHNIELATVLLNWEMERKLNRIEQWWYGYYSEYSTQFRKHHSNSVKPMGIKGFKKANKKSWPSSPKQNRLRNLEFIKRQQKWRNKKKSVS